jgi:phosphoserine phosphatase RsbU/P
VSTDPALACETPVACEPSLAFEAPSSAEAPTAFEDSHRLCEELSQLLGWPVAYVAELSGTVTSISDLAAPAADDGRNDGRNAAGASAAVDAAAEADGRQRLKELVSSESEPCPAAPAASLEAAVVALPGFQILSHDGPIRKDGSIQESVRETIPRTVAEGVVAIVNRLYRQRQQADRRWDDSSVRVARLMELSQTVRPSDRLGEALDQVLRAAVELGQFWSGAFWLWDPASQTMRMRSVCRVVAADVPSPVRTWEQPGYEAQSVEQGWAIVDRRSAGADDVLPSAAAVGLCVPVRVAAGPLGALWCFDRRHRSVTDRDIQMVRLMASQLAAALERVVLLTESAQGQRIRSELLAASTHHAMSQVYPLADTAGLDVAVRAESAAELGGDLCEIWPLGSDQTLLVLGDAVGHSVPAAMVMAIARGALRACVSLQSAAALQPDAIVEQMNRTMCHVTRTEQFMTLFVGVFHHQRRQLCYTNAGHPLPWLLRGGQAKPLQSHGLLLGVLPDAQYGRESISLQSDDVLIAFSDGVSEALSPQREMFRSDGVLAAAKSAKGTASDIATTIWQRLEDHHRRSHPGDDQTLLVIRVTR